MIFTLKMHWKYLLQKFPENIYYENTWNDFKEIKRKNKRKSEKYSSKFTWKFVHLSYCNGLSGDFWLTW